MCERIRAAGGVRAARAALRRFVDAEVAGAARAALRALAAVLVATPSRGGLEPNGAAARMSDAANVLLLATRQSAEYDA